MDPAAPHRLPTPWASPSLLTGSLDSDLQLPTASTLGIHLEVSRLLHPHTLGLQAPAHGSAGAWVTGCEQNMAEYGCPCQVPLPAIPQVQP